MHGLCRESGEEEPPDLEDLKLKPAELPSILDVQSVDAQVARQPRYSLSIRDEELVGPSGELFDRPPSRPLLAST